MPGNVSDGEFLLAAGWRQGALFRLDGAMYFWNDTLTTEGESTPQGRSRSLKSNELLVLASQDCDIISDEEDAVEALLVRIKNKPKDREYLSRILNSYRQFVLDGDQGFVADARKRFHIAKRILNRGQLDPWEMDEQTRTDFVDWLAGRYDRPPVPQAVFEAISRPVRGVLERIRDEEPEVFAALDQAVRKIRIKLPTNTSTRLDVGLVFVFNDDIDETGADALESTVERIKQVVANDSPDCHLKIDTIPYGSMLLHEFDATRPIDLDYMTDRGNEVASVITH